MNKLEEISDKEKFFKAAKALFDGMQFSKKKRLEEIISLENSFGGTKVKVGVTYFTELGKRKTSFIEDTYNGTMLYQLLDPSKDIGEEEKIAFIVRDLIGNVFCLDDIKDIKTDATTTQRWETYGGYSLEVTYKVTIKGRRGKKGITAIVEISPGQYLIDKEEEVKEEKKVSIINNKLRGFYFRGKLF